MDSANGTRYSANEGYNSYGKKYRSGKDKIDLFSPRNDNTIEATLYNAILNREASCDISSFMISDSDFSAKYNIYDFVEQNPVIDYLKTYSRTVRSGCVEKVTFKYEPVPHDYRARLEQEVTAAVYAIEAELQRDYTQAELVCVINDYIATHCKYKYKSDGTTPDTGNGYSAYHALVDEGAVCDGYASAFTLLAQQFGLDVIEITGTIMPGNGCHAWNLVKVDGEWYHVDTTWNDPSPNTQGRARHTYLLLSDKAISTPNKDGSKYHESWVASAPKANDTRYENAFWVTENAPISFKEKHFDEW
jgi:transglutaminase/protease-like cytokinesis protein 3